MSQTDSPLGTAPIGKLVLQLAIPAMLAQFVNILYSVVDRMYVGHIAGCRRCRACGRRRVCAGGDDDHRDRRAHRLRRRSADEHSHGAARHGRRTADRREQLLSAARAQRARDRAAARVPAADPVHLRVQRGSVGVRRGVFYDLCLGHGVRGDELRPQPRSR